MLIIASDYFKRSVFAYDDFRIVFESELIENVFGGRLRVPGNEIPPPRRMSFRYFVVPRRSVVKAHGHAARKQRVGIKYRHARRFCERERRDARIRLGRERPVKFELRASAIYKVARTVESFFYPRDDRRRHIEAIRIVVIYGHSFVDFEHHFHRNGFERGAADRAWIGNIYRRNSRRLCGIVVSASQKCGARTYGSDSRQNRYDCVFDELFHNSPPNFDYFARYFLRSLFGF